MTRDDDRYLTLDERAAVARRLKRGDVRLDPHRQRRQSAGARRERLFAVRRRLGRRGGGLAARENAARSRDAGGGAVEMMLADLAMRSQMSASADLASRLVNKAAGRVELRPNPHRFAAFHVLRRADAPAVLFEAGYLSNADDELLLRNPARAGQDGARPGPGDRGRRRGPRAALTGFPRPDRQARRFRQMKFERLNVPEWPLPDLVAFNERVHGIVDPWWGARGCGASTWAGARAVHPVRRDVDLFRKRPALVRDPARLPAAAADQRPRL